MDKDEQYRVLKDQATLSALNTYGVDNWSYYDEAVEEAVNEYGEDFDIDSLEFLNVLDNCGVDNWSGHDIAMESIQDYLEYIDALYDKDALDTALPSYDDAGLAEAYKELGINQPEPVREPEPVVPEPRTLDQYDRRVMNVINNEHPDMEQFNAFMRTLKTRENHPKDFDYAIKHVSKDARTAHDIKKQALEIYMSRLTDDAILHDWQEFIG